MSIFYSLTSAVSIVFTFSLQTPTRNHMKRKNSSNTCSLAHGVLGPKRWRRLQKEQNQRALELIMDGGPRDKSGSIDVLIETKRNCA
jgi:hypothetical protein